MTLRTKINLGFAMAALLVLGVGTYSVTGAFKLVDSSRWTAHTIDVRYELERLAFLYADAQSNVRAVLLTRDPLYAAQYRESKEAFRQALERVKGLTSDNPAQHAELEHLQELFLDRSRRWEEYVERGQKNDTSFVKDPAVRALARALDARVAASMTALRSSEDALLSERLIRTGHYADSTQYLGPLGVLLALVLLSAAAVLINRELTLRQEAESEIDRFFTLSLDLLCIAGMDGYFKRLSPAFAETLGHTLEDLYKSPLLSFVHPDDVKRTQKEIEFQSRGGKVLAFENRFRCQDGTYKILSWKSVPAADRMYAVARDITQQKAFENQLLETEKMSIEAARAKSVFLATMSHEIRTPLNGIIGMADLLSSSPIPREQKGYAEIIRSSGKLLLKIINEVLDFSKIESGKLELENLDFDLAQMLEAQISLVGIEAHRKRIFLETVIHPAIPRVLRGDPSRIGQVLLNLLGNAVKFTNEGKVQLLAEPEAIETGHCVVRFSVRDSGVGIFPEQVSRLFQPFAQAEAGTSRKYGGTGLGLSISKRLVEALGGELRVESAVSKGSTFSFAIRLEVPSDQPRLNDGSLPLPQGAPVPSARRPLRVLVAEDNYVNQLIVLMMIERLGHSPQLVGNGQEAIDVFECTPFDCVLMDLHMPVMDGLEACRKIRALEASRGGARTQIVAFTANAFQREGACGMEGLVDDWLMKPVTIAALERVLAKVERQLAMNDSGKATQEAEKAPKA